MNFDYAQFTAHFTRWFSTAVGVIVKSRIDGANTLLRFIETDAELTNLQHAAYLLATAAWETGYKFAPVYEQGSRHYFDRYEGRKDLGNVWTGDGFRFRGRGFVQITGRCNYEHFSHELNIDLAANPDLALDPKIAYQIMSLGMRRGLFTGKKLSDYIDASKCDYTSARRIINGNDKASTIARIAAGMEATLRVSTRAAVTPSAPPQATDAPVPLTSTGIWKEGMSGNAVRLIGEALAHLKFYPASRVSIDFTAELTAAVRNFQKSRDLVADGRVGDMTRTAINKSLANG